MFEILLWLTAFAALTPVGILVLTLCFGKTRASDYLIARFVGLAAVSAILWIVGYVGFPLLRPAPVAIALAGFAGASLLGLKRLGAPLDRLAWIKGEIAFATLVSAYVVLRGFNPTVLDAEKPMDIMLLSSSMRASSLPPEDAWFAGRPVNYYYYGFFAFGSIAKALRLSSFVAFNLGLATIWSASLLLTLHIGRSLVGSWRKALAFPLLYGFVGNLAALYQVVRAFGPGAAPFEFDWWAPSRAVGDAITEFPAFSYVLGEFHSHMIATLWLGLLIVLFQRMLRPADAPPAGAEPRTREPALGLLVGALCGATYATNSWSVLALIALGACAVVLRAVGTRTAIWAAASFLAVVVPYALHNHPPAVSVELVSQRSPLASWSVHWLILLSAVYWSLLIKPRNPFVVALAASGACLVVLPEIVMIHAFYEGRFNTVFKLWWDAWLLLSVAGAYGLVRLAETGRPAKLLAACHFAVGGLYLPLALPLRFGYFGRWYGTDPEAFTFLRLPYLKEPYLRLRRESPRAFYEPPADPYTENCLLSAFTGVPTYLGWRGHEMVWRDRDPEVFHRIDVSSRIHGADVPADLRSQFGIAFAYADGRLTELFSAPGRVAP